MCQGLLASYSELVSLLCARDIQVSYSELVSRQELVPLLCARDLLVSHSELVSRQKLVTLLSFCSRFELDILYSRLELVVHSRFGRFELAMLHSKL